jgi:hypothetical protein
MFASIGECRDRGEPLVERVDRRHELRVGHERDAEMIENRGESHGVVELGDGVARDLTVEDGLAAIVALDEAAHEHGRGHVDVTMRASAHDDRRQRRDLRPVTVAGDQRFRFADRDQLPHLVRFDLGERAIVRRKRGLDLVPPHVLQARLAGLQSCLISIAHGRRILL